MFVHIESHELRDPSARASASTTQTQWHCPSPPDDERADDVNHPGSSDPLAAFTFSDVPQSFEQSLSSQV